MHADYVNAFVTSTVSVFKTMLNCDITRTSVTEHRGTTPDFDITGIIGLSGKASGDIVISFEKQVALSATETFVGTSYDTIDDDVVDCVGELTNVIAGQAKSSMETLEMELALPTVIVGKNHTIRFPSDVKPISIAFDSEFGKFEIEVGLSETP